MAVLRCRALQRPALAAMFRDFCMGSFGWGSTAWVQPAARTPPEHRAATLNRHPEAGVCSAAPVDSSPSAIVGREAELGQLEAVLDALDEGGAACVTLEGEPGIGKTRLLGELRARAEERGHVVLSGAAAEFEREMPFSVWVDALDAYVVSQDLASHDALRRRPGRRARPGAALAAARQRRRGRGRRRALPRPPSREPAARRWWPTPQPLVLVLDDLHWSDGASIELIAALVRREPAAPVLLALGFRPGSGVRAPERPRWPSRASAAWSSSSSARPRPPGCSTRSTPASVTADLPPRRRQPVLPRAARPGQQTSGTLPGALTGAAGLRGRSACRPRWSARSAGSWRRSSPARARCSTRRRWPASRSSRIWPRRSASCPSADGARRPRRPARARPGPAHPGPAPLHLPPSARAPRGLRVGARRLAARRARPGSRSLEARGAAPAERAHHVEQSARTGRRASDRRCCWRPAAPPRRARPAPRRAGSRRRCACCRAATRSVRSAVRVELASALRSVGELERCRADAARGDGAAAAGVERPRGSS